MKNSLRKQAVLCCMVLFSGTAAPISESTKNAIAIGSGITTATLAGFMASRSTDNSLLIALCVAGAGGGSWWLLDYILTEFTPAAQLQKALQLINEVAAHAEERCGFNNKTDKLNTAETIINCLITETANDTGAYTILQQAHELMDEIKALRYIIKIKNYERNILDCHTFLFNLENNILVSRNLSNENELLTAVNLYSNTTWPLLKAKEFLFKKTTDLESFQKTLNDLLCNLLDDAKQNIIVTKARKLMTQILALKDKLTLKMSQVISHKNYAQELTSYELFQEAERQREFLLEKAREEARLKKQELQEQARLKERELQEQARLKERELQLQQSFQSSQNNKDRKLKESLANNPNNLPAQVVINA